MFLTRMSLKNRLLVGLVTVAIAASGVFAAVTLPQELMPPTRVPTATVSVSLSGSAPEQMSRTVTEPVETALRAVPGVTDVSSETSAGSATLNVSWPSRLDADETFAAVRSAAESAKSSLPATAELEVYSGSSDTAATMQISAGASGDETALADALTQKVAPALTALTGVQKVDVAGRQEQRITVDLRPADVARLKVDPAQIKSSFEAYGAILPAGEASSAEGPTSVTVGSALTTLEDLQNLLIPVEAGTAMLKDFADVKAEVLPAGALARVNGKPSLNMTVTLATGANTVQVSHAVTAELARLAPSLKAEFVTLSDQAPYIEQSIHDLTVEGGLGLLFAILVVLLFLRSWRSTVIGAVSIPLSLLISLIGLLWTENTLNLLTLGALTIAIGRVVDDSIVVIENISRRARIEPLTASSIVGSVRQVAGAITASTLTTVAVFLPIVFVGGPTGDLFRPFAVTVTIALLASLLVALTIVPVLAYGLLRVTRGRRSRATETADPAHRDADEVDVPQDRLQRAILPRLQTLWRRPVLSVTASALLLALTLGMAAQIPTDFLGSSGNEFIQVQQTIGGSEPDAGAPAAEAPPAEPPAVPAPSGEASDPATAALVAAVEPAEKAVRKVDGVKDVTVSIPLGGDGSSGPQTADYTLILDRGADAEAVSDRVRARLDELENPTQFELFATDPFAGGGGQGDDGIDLRIQGNDPAALRTASELLQKKLAKADGVRSVRSQLAGEQSVLRIRLDEARAVALGIDRSLVARVIQEAQEGTPLGQLMFEGAPRSILLRTPGSQHTAEQIGEILLPVTAQQNAAVQKAASDAVAARVAEEAAAAKRRADAEQAKQLADIERQSAASSARAADLRAQLSRLSAAPIVPSPAPAAPDQSEQPEEPAVDAGLAEAQRVRAEKVAELEASIAADDAAVTAAQEQIAQTRQAERDAAAQVAEQQRADAEQKAIQELRATPLKVSDIAAVESESVPPMIIRENGERKVSLIVAPRKGRLDDAVAAVRATIADTDLPAGVTFDVGGVSEQKDDAFSELAAAMMVAIALVLIVMIATFRNFRQPLVLLVSIPFAATGAIIGLLLTGTALGLPALIGLLMLVGIVVTNAIVLMDLINRLRADGIPLADAVTHGTRLRLRPILMTAAATIFALVPMSLGLTGGGAFISRPLAIVVIGGLISSTLLTLVLVPILYAAVERARERRLERRSERRALAAEDSVMPEPELPDAVMPDAGFS